MIFRVSINVINGEGYFKYSQFQATAPDRGLQEGSLELERRVSRYIFYHHAITKTAVAVSLGTVWL